jgi:ribosomal protein S4
MAETADIAWLVDEVASLLEISKSQARQYVVEGAVYVDGFIVDDPAAKIEINRATLSVTSIEEARRKKGTSTWV